MLIEMRVASLTVDPFTSTPIVVLKDLTGKRSVPIWIGLVEASAIATELEQIELDRPMTHDLMAEVCERLGGKVITVDVIDVRDHVFYAAVTLRDASGAEQVLDARPSDAIALALRTGATIRVAEQVIEKAKRIDLRHEPDLPNLRRETRSTDAHGRSESAAPSSEGAAALLESLGESAFGKWKM